VTWRVNAADLAGERCVPGISAFRRMNAADPAGERRVPGISAFRRMNAAFLAHPRSGG
jgi:hypothetical protein